MAFSLTPLRLAILKMVSPLPTTWVPPAEGLAFETALAFSGTPVVAGLVWATLRAEGCTFRPGLIAGVLPLRGVGWVTAEALTRQVA